MIGANGGGVEAHPMKEWLCAHAEHLPPGHTTRDSTSRQLLRALRKQGWSVQEHQFEVRLFPPYIQVSEQDVESTLGALASAGEIEEEPEEVAFHFEAQLRDFIAQNLSRIRPSGRCSSVTTMAPPAW